MSIYVNPFPADTDRQGIWKMLVERDTKGFINQDWGMVQNDFVSECFMGVDARNLSNPDSWRLSFPDLQSYKKEWLSQAQDFASTEWSENVEEALYKATTLRDIDIVGDSALVHKKFDGSIAKKNGEIVQLNWQTLYQCRKVNNTWKIAGFTGYMPHPMGQSDSVKPAIELPHGASQHVTAGPYSPVLKINPGQLVVISGQASIDQSGEIVGDTIEEQSKLTLDNCRKQLENGGSSLKDVFKVNVFLTDLDNWPRFNEVYKQYFSEPRPVRTAVQAGLLGTLLVEVELWAVKK